MPAPTSYRREGQCVSLLVAKSGASRAHVAATIGGTVVHSDVIDPAAESARAKFAARLPEYVRDEACSLLQEIALAITTDTLNRASAPEASAAPASAPWPDAVDGAVLLDALCGLLRAYMVLPPHAAEAVALWVAHTYVTDAADFTPYILVTSPVRECGKTTLLELLLRVAHRAQLTGGITAAALYRRIDRDHPTMLLDELDTRLRGDGGEALRGVLNTGFQRDGKVTICVGDGHEDRDFSTFCPKVLAGIGRVWDTVTSRSIPVRLARASKPELAGLRKIRGDRIGAECEPYRRQLLRWAADSRERLRVTDAVTPDELGARQCDVWRPLLAIADVAGGRWPAAARETALVLHGAAEEEADYGLLLLEDVRELFRSKGTDVLFSETIVQALIAREDRPWPEYRNDKPITKRGVAALLGRFGVRPKTVRAGAETAKGYAYEALLPAFTTYLPAPAESVTSVTEARTGPPDRLVTDVTDESRADDGPCDDAADGRSVSTDGVIRYADGGQEFTAERLARERARRAGAGAL